MTRGEPGAVAPRRRWLALGALALSVLTIGFDITILNVALPTIATELEVGTGALQWIVNAYVLVFAGLLLPLGALGDRYGRKRLMLIGLAVFAVASLAAAWAGSAGLVIGARAAMGIGAAIIMPITLAALTDLFAPEERGKAISAIVAAMGVGIPLGPIIGGYLLEHFWWGSVFLINVPVALIAIFAITVLLPESRDPAPPRADVVGGLLSTVGLVSFVYGVIAAPRSGWGDPIVLLALAAGVVLLGAFVRWELRTPEPMIDLNLFRRRRFLWGSVAATLASFILFGLLFVVPQYLQFVAGFDALGTGLRLLPLIGGLVAGAPLSGRLAARLGYRLPVALGLLIAAAGVLLGALTDTSTSYGFTASWLTAAGFGTGAALAPAMEAVLSVLPTERAGAGTAVTMTLRQVGGALGVALLGSLLLEGYVGRLVTPVLPAPAEEAARDSIAGALAVAGRVGDPALAASAEAAYVHGMNLVLVACAAVAIVGAAAVAAGMPARVPERRDSDAQLREPAPVGGAS